MSGYVMCYVAHEAILGLTDLKCYTMLPDSLVYACLCYFHLLPCFLAGALSLYCIVGMPIKGYYGLKCGIHPVCRHSVLGRFTWPWCLTLCKTDKDCRTSWHLYKHFKTADVWRMGSILAGPLSRCPVPVVPLPLPVSRWRAASVGESMLPAPPF